MANAAGDLGLDVGDVIPSPLLGPAGNVEFFLHARRRTGADTGPDGSIQSDLERAVEEGKELAARHG